MPNPEARQNFYAFGALLLLLVRLLSASFRLAWSSLLVSGLLGPQAV